MNEYQKATDLNPIDTHVGSFIAWRRRHGPRTEIRAYCPRHHGDLTIRTIWPPADRFNWRSGKQLTVETWCRWRRERQGGPEWCPVCGCSVWMESRGVREVTG